MLPLNGSLDNLPDGNRSGGDGKEETPHSFSALKRLYTPYLQQLKFCVPIVSIVLAALLRLLFAPALQNRTPFLTFILATAWSAWAGGLWGGLASVGLSVPIITYYFLSPAQSFKIDDPTDLLALLLYIFVGVVISAIGQAQKSAYERAEASAADARRKEQQLQQDIALREESEARFRMMADTAPVLIWVSGPDRLYTYFNRPWLKFTGRTLEQESGEGWMENIHPDDKTQVLETCNSHFDRREPFRIEYRLRRYDDTYRWVLDSGLPRFTEKNDFLGYIGSCIDITEDRQRMAEIEALNARQQLALRETHHRVRNNLQIIAAMANVWTMDGQTIVPVERLQQIIRNVLTLAEIHDILTRRGAGEEQEERVPADQVLIKLLTLAEQATGIPLIERRIEPVMLPSGQIASLALIANELILNAIKHGKPPFIVEFNTKNELLSLEVCDSGPGFPQSFAAEKAARTGLELVLTLVRHDLNGKLIFANLEGGGGRVVITFPEQAQRGTGELKFEEKP